MQYFFLEKQSPLTQRWKVRQIAFDARYRYLYYSAPVSPSELEAAAHAAAMAELNGREEENVPTVTWRKKLKLTALTYMADEYAVPPTSADFQEKLLLTLTVTGYERKLDRVGSRPKRPKGTPVSDARGRTIGYGGKAPSVASGYSQGGGGGGGDYSGRGASAYSMDSSARRSIGATATASGAGSPSSCNAGARAYTGTLGSGEMSGEPDTPPPELPSMELHLEGYDPSAVANADEVEDAEENLFRDIELVPDSNPDDLDADEEQDEEDDDDADEVLNSPTTRAMSENPSEDRTMSFYSFGSTRSGAPKRVSVVFRARNYDAFRIVSLRLRQGLVRHGLCAPLHHGLPSYDPRNGIAFATVPLHLRYQFRRLNDVVFYSFQHGHAVYVRHLREVRGLSGYLCITHDSVLLLQADGKCPRWVDLEDIVGIDYVLKGSHSFVSILAAEPMPDFLFIPIFPIYPLVSSFDAELAVEGVVGMLRRLLMQRLRADEDVSLEPLPKHEDLDADNASDVDDYDALCHIRDLSGRYDDVFRYISQNGPGRPLRWRWDNSKTPKHFTYKKDLAAALKRDEDSEEEGDHGAALSDDEDDSAVAHHRESLLPAHRDTHPTSRVVMSQVVGRGGGTSGSCGVSRAGYESLNASIASAASFTTATVAQLLAPPSSAAELRARERLRITRTDPERRERLRAQSPVGTAAAAAADGPAVRTAAGGGAGTNATATAGNVGKKAATQTAPVTVAAVAAVAAGVAPPLPVSHPSSLYPCASSATSPAPPAPSAKPGSYGLVHAPVTADGSVGGDARAQVVPAVRGTRLPANAPAVTAATAAASGSGNAGAKPTAAVVVPSTSNPGGIEGPHAAAAATAAAATGEGRSGKRKGKGGRRRGGRRRGDRAHTDPGVKSQTTTTAVAGTVAAATTTDTQAGSDSYSSDGGEEDDDEVWDSEDVDDLLEEPLSGALQTPRGGTGHACGQGRHHELLDGSRTDTEEDSESAPDEPSAAPGAVTGGNTALPSAGICARGQAAHSGAVPVGADASWAPHKTTAQPCGTPAPSMPTPTLQANTKLATDFLVTMPSPPTVAQSMAPLPAPTRQE